MVYDGANVIADLNQTGGVKRTYTWAGIDNMLAMTVYTSGIKGAWKAGGVAWSTVRGWLGKQGYAEAGQHVHHGVILRGGWGEMIPDWFKNQPWNLKPLDPPSGISMDTWHKMIEGKKTGLSPLGRWWYGTPDWLRYATISGAGKTGNAMRGGNAYDTK